MKEIIDYAQLLKLPYLKSSADEIIKEARSLNLDYKEFLLKYLESEYRLRKENGVQNKIREARFTQKKYLENYQRNHLSQVNKIKIDELETLHFIKNKENVILIGNPGVGKTHLAIGLGIKACLEGKNVLFVSVPNLVIELKEAMSSNQVHAYKKKFEKYDLVILDELGYISFDKEGSEILFNLLSNRNDKGSIIITTNLIFDRWEEIFKDPILTGAMIDRLAHKAHVIDLSGESYRIKETISWLKK